MNENERRREPRALTGVNFQISWHDADGITHSETASGLNISTSGVELRCSAEFTLGTTVYVQSRDGCTTSYGVVRHSRPEGDGYILGLELSEPRKQPDETSDPAFPDYYELLQISPNAQGGTIQRVYRYLAGHYHPDNPDTGDPEKFLLVNRAYKILSDPATRGPYDAELQRRRNCKPRPEFEGIDFLDSVDGELNRRLAVLAVLYKRCRANVNEARVSLLDLEAQMGFPRDYLDFTTWYLRSKKYITKEDNSDFSLTVLGVDFVEANYDKLPLLRHLLKAGSAPDRPRNGNGDSEESPSRKGAFILHVEAAPETVS